MAYKISLAAGQGFEPQLTASKAAVLPLDEPAKYAGATPLVEPAITCQTSTEYTNGDN